MAIDDEEDIETEISKSEIAKVSVVALILRSMRINQTLKMIQSLKPD